jgi:hypothetical protein
MSATAQGLSQEARGVAPFQEAARLARSARLRRSAPSTSWKQNFRAFRPVKDGPSGRREAAEVLDRTERSEKEALQEADGALCDGRVEPLTPTQSSSPAMTTGGSTA